MVTKAQPLTYAERLHRLTLKRVLEKAEAMAAELAEDRERSAGAEGPPARNSRSLTGMQEG